MSEEKLLGDRVDAILKSLGGAKVAQLIERVGRRPCGCGGRRDKLNAWHRKMLDAIEDMKSGQDNP